MNVPAPSVRHQLRSEVDRADAEMNLARAALLVAKEEYPQLSVERYLVRLDQLAERVKDRLAEESAPPVVLNELTTVLFEREGLKGNRDAYYDPRNSFLNDVLDRKLGIPLSLGIVLLEVAWRLGLPLEGVAFPMHFLVRYTGSEVRLLIDPYEGGKVVFEDEAQQVLDRAFGGTVRLQPSFLRTATRHDMLFRLLTNLKGVYVDTHDHERALSAVERMLIVRPASSDDIRDRGVLLARVGRAAEARAQLEEYLDRVPFAEDAEQIRTLLRDLEAAEQTPGGGVGDSPGPTDG